LWIFALMDLQFGFALDLSVEYERLFGATAAARQLTDATWAFVSRFRRRRALMGAAAPVAARVKSVLGRFVGGIGMGAALLNLGCGAEIHPAFVNVDLIDAPGVVKHDLRQGIPYDDKTYDLVYHSTMLSHLRPADAHALTRECYRVLKPGGILR